VPTIGQQTLIDLSDWWLPFAPVGLPICGLLLQGVIVGFLLTQTLGPLHTTLKGPTKYVNARWMQSPHGFLHDIKWIMLHGHLDCFPKTASWRWA
jgi:hypothetical protein